MLLDQQLLLKKNHLVSCEDGRYLQIKHCLKNNKDYNENFKGIGYKITLLWITYIYLNKLRYFSYVLSIGDRSLQQELGQYPV